MMNASDLLAERERRILQDLRARGFKVTRSPGGVWRVTGPGVDVLTIALRLVQEADLQPGTIVRHQPVERQR